jgi:hypothetical protein
MYRILLLIKLNPIIFLYERGELEAFISEGKVTKHSLKTIAFG